MHELCGDQSESLERVKPTSQIQIAAPCHLIRAIHRMIDHNCIGHIINNASNEYNNWISVGVVWGDLYFVTLVSSWYAPLGDHHLLV